MAALKRVLHKLVLISILSILICSKIPRNDKRYIHCNTAALYIAKDSVNRVYGPIYHSHPKKANSAAIYIHQREAAKIVAITKYVLLVIILQLCGDVALNPGPIQSKSSLNILASKAQGLKFCHWNIQANLKKSDYPFWKVTTTLKNWMCCF